MAVELLLIGFVVIVVVAVLARRIWLMGHREEAASITGHLSGVRAATRGPWRSVDRRGGEAADHRVGKARGCAAVDGRLEAGS